MTEEQFKNIKLPALVKSHISSRFVPKSHLPKNHFIIHGRNQEHKWVIVDANTSIYETGNAWHYSNVDLIQEEYDEQRLQMIEIENAL